MTVSLFVFGWHIRLVFSQLYFPWNGHKLFSKYNGCETLCLSICLKVADVVYTSWFYFNCWYVIFIHVQDFLSHDWYFTKIMKLLCFTIFIVVFVMKSTTKWRVFLNMRLIWMFRWPIISSKFSILSSNSQDILRIPPYHSLWLRESFSRLIWWNPWFRQYIKPF